MRAHGVGDLEEPPASAASADLRRREGRPVRTPSGIVELDCGWVVAIGVPTRGQVRLLLQFDPEHEIPSHGVKDLRVNADEVRELVQALEAALTRLEELERLLAGEGELSFGHV